MVEPERQGSQAAAPKATIPSPVRLTPRWELTNVHHILGVDCHVRTWGPAAEQLLAVYLDGASLALSVV